MGTAVKWEFPLYTADADLEEEEEEVEQHIKAVWLNVYTMNSSIYRITNQH